MTASTPTPTRTTATIRVTSIRSIGIMGGAIFTGQRVDARGNVPSTTHTLVVKADRTVIGCEVHRGECWAVAGTLESYTREIKGYRIVEDQLLADDARLVRPMGDGVIAALAENPTFGDIGYAKARRLWARFEERLYGILDDGDETALRQVLTPETAATLAHRWKALWQDATVQWLDSLAVPHDIGRKVVAFYSDVTREMIEGDPYRLLAFEATWRTVDRIARDTFAVADDDPRRLAGAVEEALYRLLARGHTVAPARMLAPTLVDLLAPHGHAGARGSMTNHNHMARLLAAAAVSPDIANGSYYKGADAYHPAGAYLMEHYLAGRFAEMRVTGLGPTDADRIALAASARMQSGQNLSAEQSAAVRLALSSRVAVIAGGNDSARAAVLRVIAGALAASGVEVVQIALSGRAARHLQELTAHAAGTIASFLHAPSELSDHHCLVIDEAGMVDLPTMYAILRQLPPRARLILAGDPSQLPPVGPGLVFHAIVSAKGASDIVARLDVAGRQGDLTSVRDVEAMIRRHTWPSLERYAGKRDGVSMLACPEEEVIDAVLRVYDELKADATGADTRVLCPTISTSAGTNRINSAVQERYRRGDDIVCIVGGIVIHIGDSIAWTLTDAKKGLVNGTLGRIVSGTPTDNEIGHLCTADFEGVRHTLTLEDMEHIALAYAITVHRAQGRRFERVIIPIAAGPLLDQSLLYTAITAGVQQVVLVGDEDAAEIAVRAPARATERRTGFAAMVEDAFAPFGKEIGGSQQ